MRVTASIRAFAINAPVCIMSATVTSSELRSLVSQLDLSPSPVLLANSPLKSHVKFSFIRRPANANGVMGIQDGDGQVLRPGLIHVLDDVYFNEMFEDMELGRTPKRAIIYFRGLEKQAQVAAYLRSRTGLKSAKESFFVSVHSELRPPTVKGWQVYLGFRSQLFAFSFEGLECIYLDFPGIHTSSWCLGDGFNAFYICARCKHCPPLRTLNQLSTSSIPDEI